MENISVAIVEDEVGFLEAWTDILQHTPGFSFSGAFNTVQGAVQQLPGLKPDIVMMDIQMSPTDSGIDCIKQIRHLCPDTQFMMFTVFEDENHIFEALKAGATSYMLKKTPSDKVLEAIRELFEGGAPMSAAIARKVLGFFHEYPPTTPAYHLTPREKQILEALAKGYYYKEIADQLDITIGNVKQRIHGIYKKMDVYNRTEAVNKYFGKK